MSSGKYDKMDLNFPLIIKFREFFMKKQSYLSYFNKKNRILLFLFSTSTSMCQANEIIAKAETSIRLGDLYLTVPGDANATIVLASDASKYRFDYSAAPEEDNEYIKTDSVFIQLDKVWPIPRERRGAVLTLQAEYEAINRDYFCRNPHRINMQPDVSKTKKNDGNYLIYDISYLAGQLYVDKSNMHVFGEPISGLRLKSEFWEQLYPGQGMTTSVSIAISKHASVKLKFADAQVPFSDFKQLMEAIEAKIRNWTRKQRNSERGWYGSGKYKC